MIFLLFIVVGFLVGRKLGESRRGFVVIGGITVASAAAQMAEGLMTTDRFGVTMLPLVGGTLVVVGMLVGALPHEGRIGTVRGAITAILGAFPAAELLAVLYRFPVAFDDTHHRADGVFYVGAAGMGAAFPAMFTVAFAMVSGHVLILGVLGAFAGALARAWGKGDRHRIGRRTTRLALVVSCGGRSSSSYALISKGGGRGRHHGDDGPVECQH